MRDHFQKKNARFAQQTASKKCQDGIFEASCNVLPPKFARLCLKQNDTNLWTPEIVWKQLFEIVSRRGSLNKAASNEAISIPLDLT